MSHKNLIIGATGRVGMELVRLLTEKGEAYALLHGIQSVASTRLPGSAEIVEFDFDRPETFSPALKGVVKVFLMARPGDNYADKVAIPFVDMAKKAGVRLIVNLTAMGVEQDDSFMLRVLEKYIEAFRGPLHTPATELVYAEFQCRANAGRHSRNRRVAYSRF